MPGACSPVLFRSSTLPLSPRESARVASITSLATSKPVRSLRKRLVSPTFEQSQILAEGRSIYKTAAHDHLFDAWMRDDITDEEIVARYSEKRINISIRGYVIRAAFPQNGPKYRGVE